jgi:hypothetical protein
MINLRAIYSILIFGWLLTTSNSCKDEEGGCPSSLLDKQDDRLRVQNDHLFSVVHQFSFDYPDTSVNNSFDPIILGSGNNKTLASGETERTSFGRCWENIFAGEIASDTLQIFSYNLDTLNMYGWEYIETNYLVLDRKTYSLEDLKSNDWLIKLP